MGTGNEDQNAKRVKDQNQKKDSNGDENANAERDPAGNPLDDQELIGGTSTSSPTNQQPSASQNNQWEQEHNSDSKPMAGQQGSEGYEDQSQPANKYSSTEDDELEEEQSKKLRTNAHLGENDLEHTDQDYRDGENRSGEDQDDGDELRNGK
ncbi:hypothetical protein [Daejeonella sp.]|uniref:hypothetical protein n=1 Tax=Daejeonella sp. TaxID=2805397 RepID=UPI003982FB4F